VGTPLGDLLQRERQKRDLTLRDVERQTGIHNAHLSQIEKGTITRPAPNILFTLAALYDVKYENLMKLAGHFGASGSSSRRAVQGAALHALDELSPKEQREVLDYMKKLVRERQSG
jgi:HTH-type transcriptional regulator, competence development regulator